MAQKYRFAKFRNAQFFLSDSETEFGRRQVLHEYPQRDTPFSEDLGRKARQFSVEGYVIGSTSEADKNALISAAEQSGPGILTHPYLGQKNVVCTGLKIKETSSENNIVRFTISFVEAGQITLPAAVADGASQLNAAADSFGLASVADFAKNFSLSGRPQFLVDSAVGKIEGVSSTLQSLTGNASSVFKASADLAFSLRNLKANAVDLLNSPATIAAQIRSSMNLLTSTFASVFGGSKSNYTAQASLLTYAMTEPSIPGTTSNRVQQDANRVAINSLIRSLALEQSCKAATALTFDSREGAIQVRDQLLAAIDDQENAASDDVYLALIELRSKISQALPPKNQDLQSIVSYTPTTTITSLQLAYELYGNVDLELDIVTRNKIANPGFLRGGQPLEVLANG